MDICATVKITLYKKAGCPWSAAVIGFLNELNIPYEILLILMIGAAQRRLRLATGSFDFCQLFHADRRLAADWKMHQINSRAANLRLPAPIALSTVVKCVERDLPDEANHFRPCRCE